MVCQRSPLEVACWPLPTVLSLLDSARRVEARCALQRFRLDVAAARGEPGGVKKIDSQLAAATGDLPLGNLDEIAQALGGLR